jgi:hypothetical protein
MKLIIIVFVVLAGVWSWFVLTKLNKPKTSAITNDDTKIVVTNEIEKKLNFSFEFPQAPSDDEIKKISEYYIEFNNKLQLISNKKLEKQEILERSENHRKIKPVVKPPTPLEANRPTLDEEKVETQLEEVLPKTIENEIKNIDLRDEQKENVIKEANISVKPEDVLGDEFNY